MTTPTNDEKELDEILFSLTDQSDWDLIGVTQEQYNELSKQLESDRAEAKQQLLAWRDREVVKARIDELDRLIDIESKTFNRWSQRDIANFFNVVGKRYRELETLKEHKEK